MDKHYIKKTATLAARPRSKKLRDRGVTRNGSILSSESSDSVLAARLKALEDMFEILDDHIHVKNGRGFTSDSFISSGVSNNPGGGGGGINADAMWLLLADNNDQKALQKQINASHLSDVLSPYATTSAVNASLANYINNLSIGTGDYVASLSKSGSTLTATMGLLGVKIYDCADGGSTKGVWLATNNEITAYTDGLMIRYKITAAGDSTTTLNVNGLGAKTVYRYNTAKLTTQYPAGTYILLHYNTTLNNGVGCWEMFGEYNPSDVYVRQYISSDNVDYPLLTRYRTTTIAAGSYDTVYARFATAVTLNPSTGKITANGFKVPNATGFLKADGSVDTKSYYHTGNANLDTVDWTVRKLKFSDNVFFELTSNGVKLTGAGFYTESFISSGVSDNPGGGSGGIDAPAMWQLLGASTNEQIASSHLTTALTPYVLTASLGAAAYKGVGTVSSGNTDLVTGGAVYTAINTAVSSAIKFQGLTSTALTDGATTNPITIDNQSYTAQKGDMVIDSNGFEFLWVGDKWQQMGDESSYVKKTQTINGHALSGNITLTKSDIGLGNVTNLAASDYFTVLENSSNQISLTIGGTNKKLTVAFATDATTATKLTTVSKTAWGRTFWTSGGVPTSISGDMTSVGNITPSANDSKLLGSSSAYWKELYAKKIYLTSDYYFEVTQDGLKLNVASGKGFYTEGFISSGVSNNPGGGSGGIDADAMWLLLADNNDQKALQKQINASHLSDALSPYATTSAVTTTLANYINTLSIGTGDYVASLSKSGSTLTATMGLLGVKIYDCADGGSTTAGTWLATNSEITAYTDGLMLRYRITVAGASTTTLNVNGLGAKTVYRNGANKLTTHYPVGTYILLHYNTTLNSGCWEMFGEYNPSDVYVRQYISSDNVDYPLLTRYRTTTIAAGSYDTVYARFATAVTLNPSTGKITANGFKIPNATGFLKADGSVDTTSYLPLSGGTLTSSAQQILTLLSTNANSTNTILTFKHKTDDVEYTYGGIGFSSEGGPIKRFIIGGSAYTVWDAENSNVYTADWKVQKLKFSDSVYFEKTSDGVRLVGAGFYTESFISSGVSNNAGGGGGGIDALAMWKLLTNNTALTTYSDTTKIASDHIPTATSSAIGGIKIGYSENDKNYAVKLSSGMAYVTIPWTDTVYSLPLAASGTRGGIKIGFSESNSGSATTRNYAVKLSSEKAYVNVPWENTWTAWAGATSSAAGTAGYMPAPTSAQRNQFLRGDGSWVSLNNYSLPAATASTLGGVKVGLVESDATGISSPAAQTGRNYGLKINSDNTAFVTVPWSNTIYSAGNGLSLSSTVFSLDVAGAKTALGLGSAAYTASTDYVTLAGAQTITGSKTFQAKSVIDSATMGAVAHVEFTRAGWSYIQIPSNGILAVGTSPFAADSYFAVDIANSAIIPGWTAGTRSIGTSSYYWKEVVSSKFIVKNGTSSKFLKADGSLDSTSYLPLTGGTLTSTAQQVLYLNSSNSDAKTRLTFQHTTSGTTTNYGGIAFNAANGSLLRLKADGTNYKVADTGNTTLDSTSANNFSMTIDGTALSITNLYAKYAKQFETSRSLWGNSFNGTADISGNITLDSGNNIIIKDANSVNYSAVLFSRDVSTPLLHFGWGKDKSTRYDTILEGKTVRLGYWQGENSNYGYGLYLNGNGNTTIGATDLASTDYKLYVDGKVYASDKVYLNNNLVGRNAYSIMYNDTNDVARPVLVLNSSDNLSIGGGLAAGMNTYVNGATVELRYSASTGLLLNSSGNVTIGATDLASTTSKLYVNGNLTVRGKYNLYYAPDDENMNIIDLETNDLLEIGKGTGEEYDTNVYGYKVKLLSRVSNAWDTTATITGGQVGIGTSSPSYKLHVAGTFYASGNATFGGSYASLQNGSFIRFKDNPSEGTAAYKNVLGLNSSNSLMLGSDTAAAGYHTLIYGNHVSFYYGTSKTLGMRLHGSTGNVGIGYASPDYKLQVNGTLYASGNTSLGGHLTLENAKALKCKNTSSTELFILHLNASNNLYLGYDMTGGSTFLRGVNVGIQYYANSIWTNGIYLKSNGRVGIMNTSPAYTFDVTGTIHSTVGIFSDGYVSSGAVSSSSDANLKEDIHLITWERAKGVLMALTPKEWKWNHLTTREGKAGAGLVAQDVSWVLPDCVSHYGKWLGIEYNVPFAYGLAAVKHLIMKYESHEQKIARLEKRVNELEKQLNER